MRDLISLRQAANRLDNPAVARDRATADLLRAIADRASDLAETIDGGSEGVVLSIIRRNVDGYRQAVALAEIVVRGEP